jgi:hypothetical protein
MIIHRKVGKASADQRKLFIAISGVNTAPHFARAARHPGQDGIPALNSSTR